MQLKIDFDRDLMLRYSKRGSPLLFGIHWEHSGVAYPSDDWLDFGSVIMGWWTIHLVKLVQTGVSQRLPFMDGPYAMALHLSGPIVDIRFSARDFTWHVPIAEFVAELRQGIVATMEYCHALGVGESDRTSHVLCLADLDSLRLPPPRTSDRR